jgi:hypothetical protein
MSRLPSINDLANNAKSMLENSKGEAGAVLAENPPISMLKIQPYCLASQYLLNSKAVCLRID